MNISPSSPAPVTAAARCRLPFCLAVALGGQLVTLDAPPEGQWLPASNDMAEPLRLA